MNRKYVSYGFQAAVAILAVYSAFVVAAGSSLFKSGARILCARVTDYDELNTALSRPTDKPEPVAASKVCAKN